MKTNLYLVSMLLWSFLGVGLGLRHILIHNFSSATYINQPLVPSLLTAISTWTNEGNLELQLNLHRIEPQRFSDQQQLPSFKTRTMAWYTFVNRASTARPASASTNAIEYLVLN
jgi:hypothetical protein